MSDKPDKCPFCGSPKTNNPHGLVYSCGTMFHGKEPYRSELCIAYEEADELESQLRDLRRAIGIFDDRPHEEAVAKAEALARDSDLFEWAEHNLSGFEIQYDPDEPYERRCRILRHADTWADPNFESHGPDLRDVLRQAMEWEEREQI